MITSFIHRVAIVILILMCFMFSLFAQQEVLRPLKYNQQLRLYSVNNIGTAAKMQTTPDTLALPFIDDFSGTSVYPDSTKWIDRYVFVNTTFPVNPPTIGVATFDGSDALGNAYDNSNASTAGACDTLTSKPIYLYTKDNQGNFYDLIDSIRLIFFVERKGRGNSVESGDSLILEFYDKDLLTWTQVWSKTGGTQDTVFSKVVISIRDTNWLDDGFQFRFINYGAATGSLDHWHLDYVLLDQNFAPYDNNIRDLAFRYLSPSFLNNNYTSVPWKHFTAYPNPAALIKSSISLIGHNNDATGLPFNVNFKDSIFQGDMSNPVFFHNGGNNNIGPLADTLYSYPTSTPTSTFSPVLNSNNEETFYLKNNMDGGLDKIRSNDSIVTKQVFRSYYAYDDGTAEAGYTITNTANAKLAMKFDLLMADTIRAVQIFFVQQYDNSSTYSFRLAIWDNLFPENLIYQRAALTPDYVDSINGFATYTIPDSILILSGSVYIGLIMNLAKDYDIGFDANSSNNGSLFYNSTGAWTPSVFNGRFMIRPVFGDSTIFAGINEPQQNNNVMLYPNPGYNKVNIVTGNENEILTAEFFDSMGRLIIKQKIQNRIADISALQKGFYTVRITTDEQKVFVRKLVVE